MVGTLEDEDTELLPESGTKLPILTKGSLEIYEAETSEKVDSGMDEDMTSTSHAVVSEAESDDDDVIINRRAKKKVQRILDDDMDNAPDEDETDSTIAVQPVPKKMNALEALEEVMKSGSEDDSEDPDAGEDDEPLTVVKKKRLVISEESDDESNNADAGTTVKSLSNVDSEPKRPDLFSSDVFDAEEDSDNDMNGGTRDDSDSDGDEGFEEENISAALLAKLKKSKGAAKKEKKKGKSPKPTLDDRTQIHSETQRLVRESRVNLPYHQPAPKPLTDFLARASRKQEEYKALRGCGVIRKVPAFLQKSPLLQKDKAATHSVATKPKDRQESQRTDDILQEKIITDHEKVSEYVNSLPPNCNELHFDEDSLPELTVETEVISDGRKDLSKDLNNPTDGNDITCTSSHMVTCVEVNNTCSAFMNNPENTSLQTDERIENEMNMELQNHGMSIESQEGINESSVVDNEHVENYFAQTDENQRKPASTPKIATLIDLEVKNITPRLSGEYESFISFDVSDNDTPQNPGVCKLMDRLLKHSQKKPLKPAQDLDLSIVQMDNSQHDLKLKKVSYHTDAEVENPLAKLDKPGAKLLALKEQLFAQMKVKRDEARQKRVEIYQLDNEEMYEEEEKEELDEGEMTDGSDTDVEDDEFDEQFGNEEFEDENEEPVNPLVDDEAEDEAEDDEDDDMESVDDDDVSNDGEEDNDDSSKLKLKLSDDDEDDEKPTKIKILKSRKKKPRVLTISDDENSRDVRTTSNTAETASILSDREKQASMIEVAENDADIGLIKLSSFQSPATESDADVTMMKLPIVQSPAEWGGMSPMTMHLSSNTQPESAIKRMNLTLPIEDSQDLYTDAQPDYTQAPSQMDSESPNFLIEDSQSQILDADGFLKFRSSIKKLTHAAAICDLDNTQNMDELLGLCSGKFAATQDMERKAPNRSLFGNTQSGSTQSNMDELLGLCSGRFSVGTQDKVASDPRGVKRKLPDDDGEGSEPEFHFMSDQEENNSDEENGVFDSDKENEDSDAEAEEEQDHQEIEAKRVKKFKGLFQKQGGLRKEFVDEEAELSGSEYDSDENLDIAEEDDIMEEEEGDKDKISEEILRDQVGRAHLKQVIDEDKRELIRLQEMYLPDGDLHSDGGGRTRQFKWRNIDDESQQDLFQQDSDDETHEEETDAELKWRMERYQREKWLEENQENDKAEDSSSQFMKFGKVFLKRKESISDESGMEPKSKDKSKTSSPNGHTFLKPLSQKRGSFLSRSKQTLAKIADMTKSVSNPTGTRNSRNFIFSVVSPDKGQDKPTPLNRSTSLDAKTRQPPAKRPKLERSASFSQKSIFNHI